MNNGLKSHISNLLNETITKISSVSGGDISTGYRIKTSKNCYFLKTNNSANALNMFKAEAYGLQLIAKTNTIKTPNVLTYDSFEDTAFLLLEFIDTKPPSSRDFKNLGEQLAKLHLCFSENFGLNANNFIGSLPQSNKKHKYWLNFYTQERLLPQLNLAKQRGLLQDTECPTAEHIKTQLQPLFTGINPSILHGDLWSGNYIISINGAPYLIDPAIYYGHNEVDIAMTQLFGGFGEAFYEAYHSSFPVNAYTSAARIEIYQLYYLLVHLNLFGRSYYGSVISILKKYF